ncbi:MAG: glycosyltransferase family 2 protein [Ginsengibacter sp.]
MKVSIITVTMNSEKYLADCINSVRRQNHKDIEHIIIDGKSTDRTIAIILQNLNHISYWISETDRGMYDAINKGLQMATGDIVGILNSDDMFASADSVKSIVDCFETTDTDSVYGDLVYVDAANTQKVTRYWKGVSYKRSRFRYGWMPAHPTFYVRRELIRQYGLYENHYYTAADYEFMARYLFLHKVSSQYIDAMLVKMRNGGISNENLKSRLRANRRDFLAMRKNQIPFSFFVSILKPLIKLPQFNSFYAKQYALEDNEEQYFTAPSSLVAAEG